jgi:cell division protein FtsB
MSFFQPGRKEGGARVRQAARVGVVALVFLFGLVSIIGSGGMSKLAAPNPEVEKLSKRIDGLRQEQETLQKKIRATTDLRSTPAMQQKIRDIEAEIEGLGQKIDSLTSKNASCFTADMQVLTENGPRPIAQLQVGDRVLTSDEQGNRSCNPVLKTLVDGNNHYYLINDRVKVTALHRFATADGWKKARELKVGDRLKTADGGYEELVSKQLVGMDLEVYNLTVADNHNFYVTPGGQGAYLVHNSGGGGGGK